VKIELIDDDLGLVAAGAALIDVHAACMQLVHLYLQCQTGVIDPLPCVYVRTYVRTYVCQKGYQAGVARSSLHCLHARYDAADFTPRDRIGSRSGGLILHYVWCEPAAHGTMT
jgi:hypothetical protein